MPNRRSIGVVVPFAFFDPEHLSMSKAFLEALTREPGLDRIVAFHNGGPLASQGFEVLRAFPVRLVDAVEWPFYRMWNEGISGSRSDVVLVLNNDIRWKRGHLAHLGKALHRSPRDVAATYVDQVWAVHRGLSGWCFAIRRSAYRPIDDRYVTWYGDHELVLLLRQAGYRTVPIKVQVTHLPSSTMSYRPDIEAERIRDKELFDSRWS